MDNVYTIDILHLYYDLYIGKNTFILLESTKQLLVFINQNYKNKHRYSSNRLF